MSKIALRKKVHQYVETAEENVLEAIYKMLKIYNDDDGSSLMTKEQKTEIDKRAREHKAGITKSYTWEEVKKRARSQK